jgi:hypothetical protein
MLVAGIEIEIVDPNNLTLMELRRTNKLLRELHSEGDVDAPKLDRLDETDKAVAIIMLSLAQHDGYAIDRTSWLLAQTVTVADLDALAASRRGASEPVEASADPAPSGRVVELTGSLQADVMLTPTSADS